MKREDLFEIIGQLEEMRLERSESTMAMGKKRIAWKLMLVAAIIISLATSVLAIPELRGALFGGKLETENAILTTDGAGYSDKVVLHYISLDVEMHENAPKKIETFYVPAMSSEYEQSNGRAYAGCLLHSWETPDGTVTFDQTAGALYIQNQYVECVDAVYVDPDHIPEAELTELGGVQGFLLEVEPFVLGGYEHTGAKKFFWSDGDYLFRIDFPYDYSSQQMEVWISSIREVKDIESYLVGMSEEEIEEFFSN